MANFFEKLKGQAVEGIFEHTMQEKVDDLREKEGDSSMGKVLCCLDESGVDVKDCMQVADKLGFGVNDVMSAAEKNGVDTADCFKLFMGAQKDDKGDMFDAMKGIVGGGQKKEKKGLGGLGEFLKQGGDDEDDGGVNMGKVLGSFF